MLFFSDSSGSKLRTKPYFFTFLFFWNELVIKNPEYIVFMFSNSLSWYLIRFWLRDKFFWNLKTGIFVSFVKSWIIIRLSFGKRLTWISFSNIRGLLLYLKKLSRNICFSTSERVISSIPLSLKVCFILLRCLSIKHIIIKIIITDIILKFIMIVTNINLY